MYMQYLKLACTFNVYQNAGMRGISSEVEKANGRNAGLEASNRRLETRIQILLERWKTVNTRHTSIGQGMQDLERVIQAVEAQQDQGKQAANAAGLLVLGNEFGSPVGATGTGDKLLQVFDTQLSEAKGLYDQIEREQASYKAKIDIQHERFVSKCEKVKELTEERNTLKRENVELASNLKDLQTQLTRETKETAEEFAKVDIYHIIVGSKSEFFFF